MNHQQPFSHREIDMRNFDSSTFGGTLSSRGQGRRWPRSAAAALCVLGAHTLASAAACTSGVAVFSPSHANSDPCFGTYAVAQQSFVFSATPTFDIHGAFTGTGNVNKTTPNNYQAVGQAFGTTSSTQTITGTAGSYSETTTSSASFAGAVLRAYDSGSPLAPQGETLFSLPTGATAYLRDQIDILFPKTSTSTTLTFTLDVSGTFAPGGPAGAFAQGVDGIISPLDQYGNSFAGNSKQWSPPPGSVSDEVTTTFVLPAQTNDGASWGASVGLWAVLESVMPNGGTVDFSHSAYIHIDVEPGVTFTSESGTVYTSATAASSVPEPAATGLLSAGLALLAAFGRTSRRRSGNAR